MGRPVACPGSPSSWQQTVATIARGRTRSHCHPRGWRRPCGVSERVLNPDPLGELRVCPRRSPLHRQTGGP